MLSPRVHGGTDVMKLEVLSDGRLAVTLRGDAQGYYVWTVRDAIRIRELLRALEWEPRVPVGAVEP